MDSEGGEAGGGEGAGVGAEDVADGVVAGGGGLGGWGIAHDGEYEGGGAEGEGGLEVEGGVGSDDGGGCGADEGAGEVADAVGAADEREDASALVEGGDIGGVVEPGEHPDGPGAAHGEDERCEEEGVWSEGDADGDDGENAGGDEHGPAFAEAGDHDAGGDVEGHGADAAEGDEEACEGGGGAEFDGVEGHDGNDGALSDGEEEGGQVDGYDQGAGPERGGADVSVHVSMVGGGGRRSELTAGCAGVGVGCVGMELRDFVEVLCRADAGVRLRELDGKGELTRLLPELEAGRGFAQPALHAFDVLGHSLAAVEAVDAAFGEGETGLAFRAAIDWVDFEGWLARSVGGVPVAALVRLGALLHDVAKPATATMLEGRLRFPRHGPVGAEMMAERLPALGLDGEAAAFVTRLVRYHLRPAELVRNGPASDRAFRRFARDLDGEVLALMIVNLADGWATQGSRYTREHFDRHCAFVSYVLARAWAATAGEEPPPLVGGDDLMAELGLSGGRLLGAVLTSVRRAQLEGHVRTREEALALAREVSRQFGFEPGLWQDSRPGEA